MKISQIFPSKYLTAADLNGKSFTLTIKSVTLEEMITHDNKKANKPVCWFEKAQKGFVMNLTNARIVAGLYGDETTDWTGRRITLYPTRVKAFGEIQDCIRVREEIPAQPRPPAQAAQVEETTGLDDDEDVADYEEEGGASRQVDTETGEIMGHDNTDGDVLFAKESPPHQRLWGQGMSVFSPDDWETGARGWLLSKWTAKVTPDNTRNSAAELNDDEKDALADYIKDNSAVLQRVWRNFKAAQVQSTGEVQSSDTPR